ncbi:MAG: stage III sporulation protein AE, partial [Lachnoclostridium sp.]|nr:stage III sporulation protein AE [Lachnoclostridium sp.]
ATVKEMLSRLTVFMQMFVPAYLLAVGTAAGASSATAYYQLFLMAAYVIEKCYLSLLMPVVYCFILLSVMNGVWMEEKLNLLLDFVEKAVGYAIKITLGIITGFSVLQSLISPVVDSLESSALKKAVSIIPGIGNLTEGMFEMVVGSAVLIKNSIGIYITIVMLFICILPILKILLLSGVLKAGAALIGIVSDKRMTNCANRVGDGSLMLLKVALSAIGLFIISIAIITCTTNRGM